MRDLAEYKSEIRRQIIEKQGKKAAFHKRLTVSLSICASLLFCCCIMLVVLNSPIGKPAGKAMNYADSAAGSESADFDKNDPAPSAADDPRASAGQDADLLPYTPIPNNAVFYGKFGECNVWMIEGREGEVNVKTVCGYKFIHAGSFAIRVERGENISDLEEAYLSGILSENEIAELYQIHKEYEFKNHNGQSLYHENE